jgi:two-component system, chemotaxis family, protein-glutamate methylesterase/glutaminase
MTKRTAAKVKPAPKRNIVVIGASAGGVDALCALSKQLPKKLDAAVFVVMHVGDESVLPNILTRCGNLPAVPAENNKRYQRGCIYVAPPQCHLMIKDHVTVLARGPRENGHRPAADVLFRSAARVHRAKVIGVVLSGGRDDGSAGLFAIKARGGVAIVQDPGEAIMPNMPQNALKMVDIDYCLPLKQIAKVIVDLVNGRVTDVTDAPNGGSDMEEKAHAENTKELPPGEQIPLSCPECNGPLFEVKEGGIARFQCFVGHAYSPESLSEEHTEALERALWTAIRKLKERVILHEELLRRKKPNKGEAALRGRLEESIGTAEKDIKLLRDVLDRI